MYLGTIPDCFYNALIKYPDNLYLKVKKNDKVVSYSYTEAYKSIAAVDSYLNDIKCVKFDRVAILAENRPEWVIAYMGIVWSGRIAVPLDTNLKLDALINLIENSETKVIFTSKKFLDIVFAVAVRIKVRLKIICFDSDIEIKTFAEGELAWFEEIEKLEFKELIAPASEEDVASIIYTSGTTGSPKGVMLTHKNFMVVTIDGVNEAHINHSDRMLCILPLYHTLAFACCFLAPTYIGGSIFFIDKINGPEIISAAQENKVTIVVGVPLLWESIERKIEEEVSKRGRGVQNLFNSFLKIAKHLPHQARKLLFHSIHQKFGGSIKFFMSGGAPLAAKTIKRFHLLGFNLLEGYGMSEAAPLISINMQTRKKPGSVGKAIGNSEIRINNPDLNGVGEICYRGLNVMKGYYRNERATREAIDEEGFLHTGDLGIMDKEGDLTICGRLKDMIVLSDGKKVFPDELEEHYKTSEIIDEIGVVGIIDKNFGERIVGVIVPDKDWAKNKGVDEVMKALEEEVKRLSDKLAPYKRLVSFIISFEPLPKTSLKKIRHFEVQRLAAEQINKNQPLKIKQENSAIDQMLLDSPEIKAVFTSLHTVIFDKAIRSTMTLNSHLIQDLHIDSLARVELGLALTRNCSVILDDDELFQLETIRDIVLRVRELKSKRGGKVAKKSWKELLQLDEEKGSDLMNANPPAWRRLVLKLFKLWSKLFWKLEVRGLENLPQEPYILAPNHVSHIDIFWISCLMPKSQSNIVYALGKKEIAEGWFITLFTKAANVIPVDREGNFLPALRLGAQVLKQNKILVDGKKVNEKLK